MVNKSTDHGGEDLCEVVCDRLRLLTGAVLMDEQQGGYRALVVLKQVSDSEGVSRAVPCPLVSSPYL